MREKSPIPSAIRNLDKQMNTHFEEKAIDSLVPWTKKGNVEAWNTTKELLWAKNQPTNEHTIFTHMEKFATSAEKKRKAQATEL
jgi:hypothetical protein